MKNMKIGKKLILCFILVTLIASISGVASVSTIYNINNQYSVALVDYGFSQGDVGKAMLMLTDSRRCVRDIVNSTSQEDVERAEKELQEAKEKYESYEAAVAKTLSTDSERELFARIEKSVEEYVAIQDEIASMGKTLDPVFIAEARKATYDKLDPAYQTLYDEYAELLLGYVDAGNQLKDELNDLGMQSMLVTGGLVLAAFAISLILAISVSRNIARPIRQTVEAACQIINGELDVHMEVHAKDETGELAEQFEKMAGNLRAIIEDINYLLGEMAGGNFQLISTCREKYVGEYKGILTAIQGINSNLSGTLTEINEASQQVAAGAGQVAEHSQSLSQGAAEQASAVEELAATITEISQQINVNSESARHASRLTE